jgi:uncharacterized protein (TIGR00159 family)
MTWRAIIDILLISGMIFFLYRTLTHLGTWKIATGVLIAVVFFILASFMGLKGIEWIYRNISHVAVIGVVVLFQPELRKMLEKAASLKRSRTPHIDDGFFKIIAESMWKLSLKRVGAIIVIPGQEAIKQWLNGGYPLHALPSVPILLSIFDPNSPGHDGAVIVQKDGFSAFGVRLPISQSGRLGEEYGTRHQSAMGLSEKSDALVVVVSEERGTVSTFHQGQMTVMDSEKQLIEKFSSHGKKTKFFQVDTLKKVNRALVLETIGSLAVAVAFWSTLIAAQGEMIEKVITVPVEYTATAEDVVLIGNKANEIRLHLAGSKSDLDAANPSELSVKIDLTKSVEGKQTFLINDKNMRLPKNVKLLDVDPSNVELSFARRVKKEVRIDPQLIGGLPDGLDLVSIEVKPEKILVFLPSEESGTTLNSVTTTPIYLETMRKDTVLFCKIISPPSIQPIEKRWPDVEIHLVVRVKEPAKIK